MESLPCEVVDYITKFVKPVDLYNWCRINKNYNTMLRTLIKRSVLSEIENRLRDIFDDLPQFLQILAKSKSVISGSFIIQCILNEYWNDTDIDIYIPIKGNNITGYTENDNPITIMEDYLYKTMKFTHYEAANRYGHDINTEKLIFNWIRNYLKGNYSIQVIQVNIDENISEVKNFIHQTFDFDICKNIYNFAENQSYLSLYKMNQICSKMTKFKCAYRLGSSIERCKKYQKRGFVFTNLNKLSYEKLANKSPVPYGTGLNHVSIFKIRKGIRESEEGIYHLISGNKNILEEAWGYGKVIEIVSRGIILRDDSYNVGECPKNCIVKFCHNKINHIHYKGVHLGHGSCTDFIFVIVE